MVTTPRIEMLELNADAQRYLKRYADNPLLTTAAQGSYSGLEASYGRLVSVFLYVNQDALPLLPRDNVDDINNVISRIYESFYWARRSLSAPEDEGYVTVDWSLIGDRRGGAITESYRLVSQRLISGCPNNLFLENALIRLMNSYHLAVDVVAISEGLLAAKRDRKLDLKKKRSRRFPLIRLARNHAQN